MCSYMHWLNGSKINLEFVLMCKALDSQEQTDWSSSSVCCWIRFHTAGIKLLSRATSTLLHLLKPELTICCLNQINYLVTTQSSLLFPQSDGLTVPCPPPVAYKLHQVNSNLNLFLFLHGAVCFPFLEPWQHQKHSLHFSCLLLPLL